MPLFGRDARAKIGSSSHFLVSNRFDFVYAKPKSAKPAHFFPKPVPNLVPLETVVKTRTRSIAGNLHENTRVVLSATTDKPVN